MIYSGNPRNEIQVPKTIPRIHHQQRNFLQSVSNLPSFTDTVKETQCPAPMSFGEARNDNFVEEFRKQAFQPVSNAKVFGFERPEPTHDPHREEKQKLISPFLPPKIDYVPGTAIFIGSQGPSEAPWVMVKTVDGSYITVNVLTGKVFESDKICDISPFEYVKQIKDLQDKGIETNMMKLSTFNRPDEEYLIPYVTVKRENYKNLDYDGKYSLDDYLTNDWGSDYYNQTVEEARIDLANIILQGDIANGNDILELYDLYHAWASKTELKDTIGVSLMLLPHLEKSASNYLKHVTVLRSFKQFLSPVPIGKEFIDKMILERQKAKEMSFENTILKPKMNIFDIISEHKRDSEFWVIIWDELYKQKELNNFVTMGKCIIDLYPRLLENCAIWEYDLLPLEEGTGPTKLNADTASLLAYAIKKVGDNLPNIDVDKINPKVVKIFEEFGYFVKERKTKRGPIYSILRSKGRGRIRNMQDQKNSHSIAPYLGKLATAKNLTVDESIEFDTKLNQLNDTLYVNEKYIHLFNPFDEKSLYHDPFLEKLHSLDIVPIFKTSKL